MTRLRHLIAGLLMAAGACCLCSDPELSSFTATMLVLLAGVAMIGAGMLLAVKGGALHD